MQAATRPASLLATCVRARANAAPVFLFVPFTTRTQKSSHTHTYGSMPSPAHKGGESCFMPSPSTPKTTGSSPLEKSSCNVHSTPIYRTRKRSCASPSYRAPRSQPTQPTRPTYRAISAPCFWAQLKAADVATCVSSWAEKSTLSPILIFFVVARLHYCHTVRTTRGITKM